MISKKNFNCIRKGTRLGSAGREATIAWVEKDTTSELHFVRAVLANFFPVHPTHCSSWTAKTSLEFSY